MDKKRIEIAEGHLSHRHFSGDEALMVADLHCDLLCYLGADSLRSVMDPEPRCSLPQLKAGKVKLQTMAIFTDTGEGSVRRGEAQIRCFLNLPKDFVRIIDIKKIDLDGDKINTLLAVENASAMFEEEESLIKGYERIEKIEKEVGKILYISFTWNLENRFGGGAHTNAGLKEDGKRLLDYLRGKKIAVDLSHASDSLAEDILRYVDDDISIIASHSNYRAVVNVPRNLPDDIAKEIISRKGLIGFNFYRDFVGTESVDNLVRQIEHALKLGGEKACCFGADFFYGGDLPPAFKKPLERMFFSDYGDASTYGNLKGLWQSKLGLSDELLSDISFGNVMAYLERLG